MVARGIRVLARPFLALHRLRVSVWQSLYEPRAVTALMVTAYVATILTGATVIHGGPEDGLSIMATVLLICGGAGGVPGAWRGAWWLEGPAAVTTSVGWVVLGVLDLLATRGIGHWPGFTAGVCVVAAIIMLARAGRVWGWSYAPGRGPRTTLEEQAARTALSRRLVIDVERHQREGDQ